MAEEKKVEEKKGDSQGTMIVAALAVVIVAAAAAYHFGFFSFLAHKEQPAPSPLDMPDAKLLLSSMQNEASLSEVHMKYVDTEDGMPTAYEVRKNSTDGWVAEQGDYGSFEGYFGRDNSSYYVCLTYQNRTKCAKTGNSPEAIQIANRLRTRLPDRSASASNRAFAQKLIAIGAMKFSGEVKNATSGAFETQEVGYTLDYRNITVQNLLAVGVQPNDPAIYSISDWKVDSWIDVKTGLLVRSNTSYAQSGTRHSFKIGRAHV
jgi:hypothetical protein